MTKCQPDTDGKLAIVYWNTIYHEKENKYSREQEWNDKWIESCKNFTTHDYSPFICGIPGLQQPSTLNPQIIQAACQW